MALTSAQMTTVAAFLRASVDPVVTAALAVRNDIALTAWLNTAKPDPVTPAWKAACNRRDLFEAMDITKFDGLTAGKRDAWTVMMDQAASSALDLSRQALRKAVDDIWGATDSPTVLTALTESATRVEVAIGGTNATTRTVTALKRDFVGPVALYDVSFALNTNP